MALSEMLSTIQDELNRTDLETQVSREISNAVTFYSNKRFWFNQNEEVTITTIQGQRDYKLPLNFAAILNVLSTLGSFTYTIDPAPGGIQYLDSIDWGNSFISSYIDYYALFNGFIRLYPPPTAGLPIKIRGTVILPALTTTAATKTYAVNTTYTKGDTVQDPNGNIQTAQTTGTTQTAPTNTYTANTAYVVGNTVMDGYGNLQICSVSGTSGYLLAVNENLWARTAGGVTQDGTAQWTLTATQWSTDYLSYTQDNTVVWRLTTALSNGWMTSAEELIRTRATRMIYARYINDAARAQSYKEMESEALNNLYEKNIGQTTTNAVRAHW